MLNNNNNGHLDRPPTQVLSAYTLFGCTYFQNSTYTSRAHARTHARTHTHIVVYQGNGTEEKVYKKRKVLKEDLKELTEAK